MSSPLFTLSAFGDEIADDLLEQLQILTELGITQLDFRSAWGVNVLHMSDREIDKARLMCDQAGIAISCVGSPIGKSLINEPPQSEIDKLLRVFQAAHRLGTRRIRIFSFYPPNTSSNARYDDFLPEAIARLAQMAHMAGERGFELLLENEKGIVGDTPERCQAIMAGVNSRHLRFLWDPANFIQVGIARPMDTGWNLLDNYIGYIHIKDARFDDGAVCAAGKGDGQILRLLQALRDTGYDGVLALEPHLVTAGHSKGFSGVSGMRYAVKQLRQLLVQLE